MVGLLMVGQLFVSQANGDAYRSLVGLAVSGLDERQFKRAPHKPPAARIALLRRDVGDQLGTVRKAKRVAYTLAHGEVGIAQPQFRLQAGEDMLFIVRPIQDHLDPGNAVAAPVEGLDDELRQGSVGGAGEQA